MERYTRKSIFDTLSKYDYLENSTNSFIEITEWRNEEGYNITIETESKNLEFSLSIGQIKAINHLINCLEYGEPTETSDKE